MDSFLTPNAPVIAELRLTATLLRANHTAAAQGDVAPYPVVGHGVQGLAVLLEHDLLALEALVGLLEAALVHAQPAAVAEGALQDVLPAHAAVGGVAEQVRVVPPVLALAEDVPAVQLPARPLKAAPEGDEHGQQHRAQRPQDQVPVRKQARVGLRPLLSFHLLQGRSLSREARAVHVGLRCPACPPSTFQVVSEVGGAHLLSPRPNPRTRVLALQVRGPAAPRGRCPARSRSAPTSPCGRGLPAPRPEVYPPPSAESPALPARWRTWAARRRQASVTVKLSRAPPPTRPPGRLPTHPAAPSLAWLPAGLACRGAPRPYPFARPP